MDASVTISRPELTMPEAEAALLRDHYARAGVILEYGSGGSTVMAAEMPGKRVFSVESDKAWMQKMRDWFAQNPPAEATEVDVVWSDIGPTKAWGFPKGPESYLNFPGYALDIWSDPGFMQPDVVLVDGRFRPGCAMAVAVNTSKPIDVLIDDYKGRREYHALERFIGEPVLVGRMGHFVVNPRPINASDLPEIIQMMLRP